MQITIEKVSQLSPNTLCAKKVGIGTVIVAAIISNISIVHAVAVAVVVVAAAVAAVAATVVVVVVAAAAAVAALQWKSQWLRMSIQWIRMLIPFLHVTF